SAATRGCDGACCRARARPSRRSSRTTTGVARPGRSSTGCCGTRSARSATPPGRTSAPATPSPRSPRPRSSPSISTRSPASRSARRSSPGRPPSRWTGRPPTTAAKQPNRGTEPGTPPDAAWRGQAARRLRAQAPGSMPGSRGNGPEDAPPNAPGLHPSSQWLLRWNAGSGDVRLLEQKGLRAALHVAGELVGAGVEQDARDTAGEWEAELDVGAARRVGDVLDRYPRPGGGGKVPGEAPNSHVDVADEHVREHADRVAVTGCIGATGAVRVELVQQGLRIVGQRRP